MNFLFSPQLSANDASETAIMPKLLDEKTKPPGYHLFANICVLVV